MNAFIKSAKLSDKLLVAATVDLGWELEFPTDQFSIYDAIATIPGKGKYLVETKLRNRNYPTMMMEDTKASNLLKIQEAEGYDGVIYVNTLPSEGFAYIWFITREALTTVPTKRIFAPATTSGDNRKYYKLSYLLPTDEMYKFNLNTNYYE